MMGRGVVLLLFFSVWVAMYNIDSDRHHQRRPEGGKGEGGGEGIPYSPSPTKFEKIRLERNATR